MSQSNVDIRPAGALHPIAGRPVSLAEPSNVPTLGATGSQTWRQSSAECHRRSVLPLPFILNQLAPKESTVLRVEQQTGAEVEGRGERAALAKPALPASPVACTASAGFRGARPPGSTDALTPRAAPSASPRLIPSPSPSSPPMPVSAAPSLLEMRREKVCDEGHVDGRLTRQDQPVRGVPHATQASATPGTAEIQRNNKRGYWETVLLPPNACRSPPGLERLLTVPSQKGCFRKPRPAAARVSRATVPASQAHALHVRLQADELCYMCADIQPRCDVSRCLAQVAAPDTGLDKCSLVLARAAAVLSASGQI
jgi:hypothetical protein